MKFIPANKQHLLQIMPWFITESELYQWGGPHFRYPFTDETFHIDSKLVELDSYVIVNPNNMVVAFGQFYERLSCCHLGRLVVAPESRGQGHGQSLINKLIKLGSKRLGSKKASLFVLEDNIKALSIYQLMGFEICTYPEKMDIENCLYMQKKL